MHTKGDLSYSGVVTILFVGGEHLDNIVHPDSREVIDYGQHTGDEDVVLAHAASPGKYHLLKRVCLPNNVAHGLHRHETVVGVLPITSELH